MFAITDLQGWALVITAGTTGMATLATAIGAVFMSWRNGVHARADAVAKDEKLKALDASIKLDAAVKDGKLEVINGLVDGRMSKALAEISELRGMLARLTDHPQDVALAAKAKDDVKRDIQLVDKAADDSADSAKAAEKLAKPDEALVPRPPSRSDQSSYKRDTWHDES